MPRWETNEVFVSLDHTIRKGQLCAFSYAFRISSGKRSEISVFSLASLYLFLVNHDLLNEQPQQLWRQFRDIRVPLRLIQKAVCSNHRFPQALDFPAE